MMSTSRLLFLVDSTKSSPFAASSQPWQPSTISRRTNLLLPQGLVDLQDHLRPNSSEDEIPGDVVLIEWRATKMKLQTRLQRLVSDLLLLFHHRLHQSGQALPLHLAAHLLFLQMMSFLAMQIRLGLQWFQTLVDLMTTGSVPSRVLLFLSDLRHLRSDLPLREFDCFLTRSLGTSLTNLEQLVNRPLRLRHLLNRKLRRGVLMSPKRRSSPRAGVFPGVDPMSTPSTNFSESTSNFRTPLLA